MSSNKVVNVLPYLALEERPNSYIPIDLSLLDITANVDFKSNPMTLEFIDSITGSFSEDELRESIRRSNIVKEEYCNAPFVIIYKSKSLDVMTKDNVMNLNMLDVVNQCMKDKQEANKFWNKVKAVAKKYFSEVDLEVLLKNLKQAFLDENTEYVVAAFNTIPYAGQRELAFYYCNFKDNNKDLNSQKLQRSKEE